MIDGRANRSPALYTPAMKLPELSSPARYQGLYVFDFGEWTAVGYTAEEIAALLETSERTVRRDWLTARLWLRQAMQADR